MSCKMSINRGILMTKSGRDVKIAQLKCSIMSADWRIFRDLFFRQAEDGIRDGHVTGIQTCALPISITLDDLTTLLERRNVRIDQQEPYFSRLPEERRRHWSTAGGLPLELLREESHASKRFRKVQIGRASCRAGGEVAGVGGGV